MKKQLFLLFSVLLGYSELSFAYDPTREIRPVKLTAEIIVFVAVKLNHVYRHLVQDFADNVRQIGRAHV